MKQAWVVAASIAAVLIGFAGIGTAFGQSGGRGAVLAPGWNRIEAGKGTRCIDGGSYAFFVRPGSPSKLAIVLKGGGPCWSAANCDTCGAKGRHGISAGGPPESDGLLDLRNPRNPIRDYTVVFLPNCNRDVLLGSRVVPYPAPPSSCRSDSVLVIHHTGSSNVTAALVWVYAHVSSPRIVFVTGESGGAIPSPIYTAQIARHYPNARVVQLGDAAGGYVSEAFLPMLQLWGAIEFLGSGWPGTAPHDSLPWTTEKIYEVAARVTPRATFAQINSAADEEQTKYLKMVGIETPVSQIMARNLDRLHRSIGTRFHSFTIAGDVHSMTVDKSFYTAEQGGVKLRDWVATLLERRTIRDVGNDLLVKRE